SALVSRTWMRGPLGIPASRALAARWAADRELDALPHDLICNQMPIRRDEPPSVQIRRRNDASNWSSRRRSPNSVAAGAHNESPPRTRLYIPPMTEVSRLEERKLP